MRIYRPDLVIWARTRLSYPQISPSLPEIPLFPLTFFKVQRFDASSHSSSKFPTFEGGNEMRVFCPEHKIGFFTPRRNPIRCKNRDHVLGEFVFTGNAAAPVETLWQYCCNCEQFCPLELDQGGLETCRACARPISQIYVCDQCFTVTIESSTPIQAKNFHLTSDGFPKPSCPGCLQETSADLHKHDCQKLGARFITALHSCPICLDRLGTNTTNVTFDYSSGLFVPFDNGEFVLVSSGSDNMLVPRTARFESKGDFYDLYQDYYHCASVAVGEVQVLEPAYVERVREGWKLKSMGALEIVNTRAMTDAVWSAVPIEKAEQQSPGLTCRHCGSEVDTRYTYCWSCGCPTGPEAVAPKQSHETTISSRRILTTEDESTIKPSIKDNPQPIFSWAAAQPLETSPTSSRLQLIAFVGIGLLLLGVGGFLLRGLVSQFGRSDAQQVTSNLQSATDVAPKVVQTANAATEPKAPTTPSSNSAEEDLQKLRERRVDASPSDRLTVLQLLANTEKQYPNDYRFPYERAKLAIDRRETKSHDDAFNALSLAAEEAIRTGKAQEMLALLEADKLGDFHKLARGHHEWAQIIEALKQRDATLLISNVRASAR